MNNLRKITQKFNIDQEIEIYEKVEMSRRFSFRIGGIASLVLEPLTENAFCKAVNILSNEHIPFFILGGGTNIVFSNKGYEGAVISTVKLNKIEKIKEKGEQVIIKCQSGALMNSLVNYAVKQGFSGLEEFCGLPGTCGGACYMNARCFNREISDVVGKIEYLKKRKNGKYIKKVLKPNKKYWSYKISPFTNSGNIILSLEFHLKKTQDSSISEKASSFMKERIEKGHFKFPCAGSVFKNNHSFGKPTGQIIDELGLKGYSIGGAQIAPWHGNIIINRKNASSDDIRALVDYIKAQVKEKTGFELEEEILFY